MIPSGLNLLNLHAISSGVSFGSPTSKIQFSSLKSCWAFSEIPEPVINIINKKALAPSTD